MNAPGTDPEAVVRAWVERVWNERDASRRASALAKFHPPEFLNEGNLSTPDSMADWHATMRATYPDLHYRVDDVIRGDNRITFRWTATGTQLGALWGIVPPTARTVSWRGLHLVTVKDGQITEIWAAADTVGMLQQLNVRLLPPEGTDPPPPAPPRVV
jgi:predicted ester cyclase